MCLILFAYKQHPNYHLVLTANRDEFYERPTAALQYWQDYPQVLAGRDLLQQGTWMGITRSGRFAAVTNYREVTTPTPNAPSRGHLVADFLTGTSPPAEYLQQIRRIADKYSGFNLIVGDTQDLYYFGNRDGRIRLLESGIYGLSNHLLNTNWPKVRYGKAQLSSILRLADRTARPDMQDFLTLLQNQEPATDDQLPHTGVGIERERMLSPIFITSPDYGTRSSSVLMIDQGGHVDFREISWSQESASPRQTEDRQFSFTCLAE
jgi:uncharacterized protein with NRDE domain